MTASLPQDFAELEPFVSAWAIAGANNRALKRNDSTEAERQAFYAAVLPALPKALDYLDRKPLAALDERERRLMLMMLSFAHIALAVEALGDAEAAHAEARKFLTITKAPADH